MKLRFVAAALAGLALFVTLLTPSSALASAQSCLLYDFKQLFIADYSTGSKWDNSQGDLEITWSANAANIYDENMKRAFSANELIWIRTAFNSWDNALSTLSFREVQGWESPQIAIGFVDLKPSNVQLNAMGFWNTWVQNGVRTRATIKLKASETKWFSNKAKFTHTVQHELGNVLGLGDLAANDSFISVLEDPWQPPYGNPVLGSNDVAMIRQLYGESECASSLHAKA